MWECVPGVVPGAGPGPPIVASLPPARATSARVPGSFMTPALKRELACTARDMPANQPR
jgi:hypothetical protein